ncbi:MAG: asparagine synthase (glutamine-hydrolyzing) [Chthoniobacterales bacterium]|nr:asparagine synthase (glutamine-hydrolyzing) [Chthoniobacterales bacterium]
MMCGIAGIWTFDRQRSAEVAWVRAMLTRLAHRGPDDQGIWQDHQRGVFLGHRRLAVVDLSPAGHQPMMSNGLVIIFNGEIYNFKELRSELESDIRFQSATDTEVLLHGYKRWGLGLLDRLVGMFAFAIWDSTKEQLFLARDRMGEKPLYYCHSPNGFAFASELGALTEVLWADCSLDRAALALYLQYQYVPAPLTIYQGVRKLLPGHAMVVKKSGARIWRYWDPGTFLARPRFHISDEEATERTGDLLRTAVAGQMIADVPVGAFLSGGIDSSAVVALMTELAPGKVKTFTIGFEFSEYDESSYAAEVARRLGTDHTCEVMTERQTLDLIPTIPEMYGEPFADPSALPTHLVSCVARKQVTVSLSGDGGDEVFGGYTRYVSLEQLQALTKRIGPLGPLIRPLARHLPGKFGRAADLLGCPAIELYRRLISVFSATDVMAMTGINSKYPEFDRAWNTHPSLSARRRAMMADFLTYLPEAILVKVDRASMATSLETRAPFLDHRVAEFALQLPNSFVRNKLLLRSLVFQRLPKELMERPKSGFGVPLARWFRGPLAGLMHDALSDSILSELGISKTPLIRNLCREHAAAERDHAQRLWALVVLSLWWSRRPRASASEHPTLRREVVTAGECAAKRLAGETKKIGLETNDLEGKAISIGPKANEIEAKADNIVLSNDLERKENEVDVEKKDIEGKQTSAA